MASPLFEFTKKDVVFIWDQGRHSAFDDLKRALVQAPVLVRPNFREPFCLDVDWSTRGVGAILFQKEGRFEKVIAYAKKGLDRGTEKVPPHGRRALCSNLGNFAFQTISTPNSLHVEDGS